MSAPNLNYAWAKCLIDALVEAGVQDAVVCPGSRSSPLAVTCAQTEGLRTWSVIDERSAAFFGLGQALASGRPTVLIATSGTAGAHFLPAVIEAAMSHVPLVVLTADRPWELQGFGAPQTIPQQALFGRFVRRFEDLALPEATPAAFRHLHAVVTGAVLDARSSPRGAVHLNVPFREPLAPTAAPFAPVALLASRPVRHPASRAPDAQIVEGWAQRLSKAERGLIVCGPRADDGGFGPAVAKLAEVLGWPVFAEAASNARFGHGRHVVAHYEALLQHPGFVASLRPDVVLRTGGGLTSKRLQSWLDGAGAEVLQVSDDGASFDPHHTSTEILQADATALVGALAERLGGGGHVARASSWATHILSADQRVQSTYATAFADDSAPLTEPGVARAVVETLPTGAQLFVSSSMPVREVDAYAAAGRGTLRVFANRGANGIDGIVSSALGVASRSERPTVLLTGDLAFLHDVGGLLTARRHGLRLCIVVVNNDGGGIFSFLPIAQATPHFESLFGTPHGLDLGHAARLYGAQHHVPASGAELRRAVTAAIDGGLHVVEVKVPREANPAVHRALAERTVAAIGEGV